MSSHDLLSALMLTAKFSKMYCTQVNCTKFVTWTIDTGIRNSTWYIYLMNSFGTVQWNISISETVRNRTHVHIHFFWAILWASRILTFPPRTYCVYQNVYRYLVNQTPGDESFRSRQSPSYLRIFQHFTKPDGLLPSSQDPTTGTHYEPNQSILYYSNLFPVISTLWV
jgi:hypothetical protein